MVNLERILDGILGEFDNIMSEWKLGCGCFGIVVSGVSAFAMVAVDMEHKTHAREEYLQQQRQYVAYQRECVLSIAKTLSHAKSEHDGDLRSVGAPVIVDKWGTSMTVRYGNKYYFDGDFILDCSNGPTQVIQNNDQLTIYLGMEQMKEYSKK